MQRDQRKRMKNKIRKEIGRGLAMTGEEERNVFDVWSLSLEDRWKLYRLVYICTVHFLSNLSLFHLLPSVIYHKRFSKYYPSICFPSLTPFLYSLHNLRLIAVVYSQ